MVQNAQCESLMVMLAFLEALTVWKNTEVKKGIEQMMLFPKCCLHLSITKVINHKNINHTGE